MTDYELHRIITAWLQVGAVVVAAVALMFSQVKARFERRVTLQAIAHDGLLRFIEFSAKHPNLHLMEEPEKRVDDELSQEDLEIERSAYLLLILAYEKAYRFVGSGGQRKGLRKIERLILAYATCGRFRETVDLYTSFSDDRFSRQLYNLVETQPATTGVLSAEGNDGSPSQATVQRSTSSPVATEDSR